MVAAQGFTRFGQIYLWSVIVAGLGIVAASVHELYIEPLGGQWFILAALTLISGSATIRVPSSNVSISTSETFVFTAALLYGPAAGTMIVVLDALVISFWVSNRHDEPHRVLFNLAAPALSVWCSAHLFFYVAGVAPLVKEPAPINGILPALAVFALVHFGLNSWLITFVIALEKHLNPVVVWKRAFVRLSLNYLGGASVAFLLVGSTRKIDLGYIGLIIPLLLVLYFTFKTTMGRIEDAHQHVEQLNRLYLSTIETLAMAIDAKDQVTHGHIRRVQSEAMNLARHLGIRDETQLQAIATAALLHDMGKLAVPEHILNKPGKLTDAEFAKMKLHAGAGADILSMIEFPYPVVPMVRHHHENWDGSGYPDGISGADIPIGARILSVVDCFDALTSDRPYRKRMSDDEAVGILVQRRGSMYDPAIVDTFLKMPRTIDTGPSRPALPSAMLSAIRQAKNPPRSSLVSGHVEGMDDSAEVMSSVDEPDGWVEPTSFRDSAEVIACHARTLIPSSLCVFYLYDRAGDALEARFALGEGAAHVRGMRIGLGQRVSGWVAANRQTIVNSDAMLDLEDANAPGVRLLPLRSCLSTPLVVGVDLLGVLALYSAEIDGFDDVHVRLIEAIARDAAPTLKSAADSKVPDRVGTFTLRP